MIANFSKRAEKYISLFQIKDNKEEESNALFEPWGMVENISSNCPIHKGVKLEKIGDNEYFCPVGREKYKSHGSVNNQTNKDNYDKNFDVKKQ